MSTSSFTQLSARLDRQSEEITTLRSALAVQFTRIAQMQVAIDRAPRKRSKTAPRPWLANLPTYPELRVAVA